MRWGWNNKNKKQTIQYECYNSIEFLPVGCFYKCLETADLRYIFVLPSYQTLPETKQNPITCWQKIYKEFLAEAGSDRLQNYIMIALNVLLLKCKLNILTNAINLLIVVKDESIIKLLKTLNYQFNYKDDIEFSESLRKLINQVKLLEKQILVKEKEVNDFNKENKKEKVDLYNMCTSLSKYLGFQIDIWKTSTKQFLMHQKNYSEFVNAQNK
jgi:hypothetical protein